MKTVTGSVVSTNPISLSKATSILSNFTSADKNGASQAVKAYLRRAAAAFSDLKHLHKDVKRQRQSEGMKRPTLDASEDPSHLGELIQEPSHDAVGEGVTRKKKEKKRRRRGKDGELVKNEGQIGLFVDERKEKKKKKKRSGGER